MRLVLLAASLELDLLWLCLPGTLADSIVRGRRGQRTEFGEAPAGYVAGVGRGKGSVILIDKGLIRFDGTLDDLSTRFGDGRRMEVTGPAHVLEPLGFEIRDDRTWQATVPACEVNALLARVLHHTPQADISISDPPLEDVLRRAFGSDDAAPDGGHVFLQILRPAVAAR